jgi:hypothetical protein
MAGYASFAASAMAWIALSAVVSGCAQLETAGGTSLAYDCGADRNFNASFSEDWDTASVTTEDATYDLSLIEQDDGSLVYSDEDGDVRLVVDQDDSDAELEIEGGDDFEDCRAERSS